MDVPGDILQENHYYPFGMNMSYGWLNNSSLLDNRYQYNGKELNEDFGLNWSDYGARWYDASVGRWWSVDLMAEKTVGFSVYTYALNNPALLTDPNGMLAGNPFEVMEERKQKAKERADERNRQIEERIPLFIFRSKGPDFGAGGIDGSNEKGRGNHRCCS